ncbi:MAG TPA: NUDIX domain-containing protein [Candidatus Limnocylindria bacterium]|nr:NUDIX domain-containing protein [Candidatus Limnocylindria bacterium]
MTLHADALRELSAWAAPTSTQDGLRLDYLAHLRQQPDGLLRTCVPDHVTASLLVMTPEADRVLLTLHARSGRWFQLGGHTEPGDESLVAAALREGHEESGLDALDLVTGGPLLLDRHEVSCKTPGARRHLDVQYLAVTAGSGVPVVSEESLDVGWFTVDALPDVDRSVLDLVAEGRVRLGRATRSSSAG